MTDSLHDGHKDFFKFKKHKKSQVESALEAVAPAIEFDE